MVNTGSAVSTGSSTPFVPSVRETKRNFPHLELAREFTITDHCPSPRCLFLMHLPLDTPPAAYDRHNKNKPAVSRSRKGREAMASAADPLRIAGKTIEIADPGQDGAVVLTGKVTWFDQDRSRYCIMQSVSGVGGSSSGGGGSCSGGLEAMGGCAHWLAAEKLVRAKAVRVDLRSGKRFAVEPPPSVEGGEEETDSESEPQGDSVKIEENDNEEERGCEDREKRRLSPTEGDKDKRDCTAGDEEQKREDGPSSVLEENETDETEVREVTRVKRGRGAMVPSSSSPGAAPTKRAARVGMQTRRELDLQRTQQETGGAAETPPCPTSRDQSNASVERDEDDACDGGEARDAGEGRDGDEAASENGDAASSTESGSRTPIVQQQRRRLLPSVQVPPPPQVDPFSRYPIRGRLKRPSQPAESQESNAVEGVSSAKKRRAGEDKVEEVVIPATADSDSTSNEGMESPDEVPAADDAVRPAPASPEMNEGVPFGPTRQPHLSTDVTTTRGNGTEVVQPLPEQASCTAYVVEPGWPNGRDTPGQIPVMRVRTIRITGGKEAMFFASAHTGVATSAACGKRSTSRFFFPFEKFEEVEAACAHEERPRQGEGVDESLRTRPQQTCEPAESQEEGGAGDVQKDDVAKVEAAKEDAHLVGDVKNPRSEEAKENRGEGSEKGEGDEGGKGSQKGEGDEGSQKGEGDDGSQKGELDDGSQKDKLDEGGQKGEGGQKDEGGKGSDGDEGLDGDKVVSGAQAAELPKDTMSPPQGDDTSEMEDGEIETRPDGRADIMPPSPRDEDMEPVADVIGHSTDDVLEVEVAEGSDSPPNSVENQTVGHGSDGTDGVQTQMDMLWAQDMTISSDEQSCGEPEGVETSSFCSFEDVLRRAEDASLSDGASATTNIGGHACDPTGATGSNVAACSPAMAEIAEAPQEHLPGDVPSSRSAEPTVRGLSDDERTGVESTEAETTTAGQAPKSIREPSTPPPSSPDPHQQAATVALRTIVREQLQGILKSASKGGEAALASGNGAEVFERIAVETEEELFGRLYNHNTGGREYKVIFSIGSISFQNSSIVLRSIIVSGMMNVGTNVVGCVNHIKWLVNCGLVRYEAYHALKASAPTNTFLFGF